MSKINFNESREVNVKGVGLVTLQLSADFVAPEDMKKEVVDTIPQKLNSYVSSALNALENA